MVAMKIAPGIAILAIVFILFSLFAAYASQPEGGWKKDSVVEGEALVISWQDSENRPKVVAWMQYSGIPQTYLVPEGASYIEIPRKGVNVISNELMVIPENNRLKPAVIDVAPDIKEVQSNPEPIPQDEVWFWGFTPPDPCPSPSGPSAMSVTARLINKKGIYKNIHGAFVWSIKIDSRDKYEVPFYFIANPEGVLKSVSIKGFDRASDIFQALCHAHHGAPCKFALETDGNAWGRSHQIIFEPDPSFERSGCSV